MGVIRIGTAPDSWGVWLPVDSRQIPYTDFLDQVSEAGYRWIELGPYGYLPTDPHRLRDELDARDISVSAGTVFENLHRPDSWDAVWRTVAPVASLTAAAGGSNVVVIPQMWRDQVTGAIVDDAVLTAEQWQRKLAGIARLGRTMFEEFGVRLQYHPHADSHIADERDVYRLLDSTDPQSVNLCLDTGHYSYCGGDNLAVIHKYPERIGYLHLKQVDPAVLDTVNDQGLSFGAAVSRGVMVEPPHGVPEFPPLLDALSKLEVEVFAIVEQDLFPCGPDVPLPIARRTRSYLSSCGISALRFR